MIVDAQVHSYEARPEPTRTASASPPEVNGEQMLAAMDEAGVDAAVLVSAWGVYRTDTTFAESVYLAHPDRFRIVAPIDPTLPGVEDRVAEWARTPGAVGIRLPWVPNLHFDAGIPGVAAAVDGATAAGLVVNVQCWGNLPLMDELARRFPDAQFALDHLGLTQPLAPPVPPGVFDDLPAVLALAQYPNIAIKITGACTYSQRPFPYDDLWEPVGRVIDTFGLDRCMWGTDWTRAVQLLTYPQGVGAFRDHWPMSDSEKANLMGNNALRIYDWSKFGEPPA